MARQSGGGAAGSCMPLASRAAPASGSHAAPAGRKRSPRCPLRSARVPAMYRLFPPEISQDIDDGAGRGPRPWRDLAGKRFATVLADPPWRFINRTGKVAPEHRRLSRYPTLTVEEIAPSGRGALATPPLLPVGTERAPPRRSRRLRGLGFHLQVQPHLAQGAQGRRSDGRGVGFYFRNVTESSSWHARPPPAPLSRPTAGEPARHPQARALPQARRAYPLIEACSPGPYLELFGRGLRKGWTVWATRPPTNTVPTGTPTPTTPAASPPNS